MPRPGLRKLLAIVFVLVVCAPPTFAFPDRVVLSLDVGKDPSCVAIDGTGRYAYVANTGEGTVARIDLFRFTMDADALAVGDAPVGIAVRRDNARVYVANSGSDTVSVITATDFTLLSSFTTGKTPVALAAAPDQEALYVVARDGGSVSAYNTSDTSLKDSLALGEGRFPVDVAATPDGKRLVVPVTGISGVLILDAADFVLEGSVDLGGTLQGVAVGTGSEFAYLADSGRGTVYKIRIGDRKLEKSVEVGNRPYDLVVSPDNTVLWVSLEGEDTVEVLRVSDLSRAGTSIRVGDSPQGLALTPDGDYLLAANRGDGTVSVVTDVPFLVVDSLDPPAVGTSESHSTARMTWHSDRSGTYWIEVGGSGVKGTGRLIESGSVVAGEQREVEIGASDLSEGDGEYLVFAYVEDADTSKVGRIAGTVILDTEPPLPPEHVQAAVGDGMLRLSWDQSTDTGSGIAGYRIRFGTQSGALDREVNTGDVTRYDLTGLTNGVRVFVTVSALDQAGNESEPSEEISEIPETVSGAVPAGGGCFVDTVGSGSAGWLAVLCVVLVVLVAAGGRFGSVRFWVAMVLVFGMGTTAFARDFRNITGIRLGFKGGYYLPASGRIRDVYDHGGFGGSATVTWINQTNFETTFGGGAMLLKGSARTSSGRDTGVDSNLLIVPVEFTVRYRFEFTREQIVIPYVDGGLDAVYYRETVDGPVPDEDGFTGGYHGSVGVRVLLNAFAREDAELFLQSVGVKKTFLFVEGRYLVLDGFGREDFDLGGFLLTMGVDLEF